MSLPWLSEEVKPSSRSRSNSPASDKKNRPRVDQFGRTLPSRSKSRSKSRDRDRGDRRYSRESGPFRERGRREDRDGRRQKRRRDSDSSSSSSDHSVEQIRLVAREEPKYLNARVFVANIVSKEVTKEELTKHFEKYGNVVDLLIHPKNYAFIQYLKEDHARLAVEGEHGSTLKGWRLDVKMANEGRRGAGGGGGTRGRGRGRGGPFEGGRGGGGRDRSPMRDDPFGNPFRPGAGGPRGPPPPFPGEFGMRDPYFPPDPYRRGFPDPWLPPPPDDPFRRDPYADPYRDPFPAPRAPPPPIECEIFVVSSQLRAYGEAIEDRVKDLNIITAVTVMPEGRTASQMLEDLSHRDGLFAVFVNAQNETHRSLTLNILHGTPQEHRNMPLNDAVSLIGRSFEQYVEALREKANAAAGSSTAKGAIGSSRVFLPPTQEVTYLMNLLADNRALTVDELDQVIKYLQERRDKLIDAERRPLAKDEAILNRPMSQHEKPQMPSTEEIKNKILSIFTNAAGSLQGVPPANGSSQSQQQGQHLHTASQSTPAPPPPPPPPPASSATSSASLINFDNPNVQKALDNLIQSSPVLLKNFNNTKASMSEAHMAGSTATSVSSAAGSYGYGASHRAGDVASSSMMSSQMMGGGAGGSAALQQAQMMQSMMYGQEGMAYSMPSRGGAQGGQAGPQPPQQQQRF